MVAGDRDAACRVDSTWRTGSQDKDRLLERGWSQKRVHRAYGGGL